MVIIILIMFYYRNVFSNGDVFFRSAVGAGHGPAREMEMETWNDFELLAIG